MSLYDTYMDYVKPFKGSPRYHRWSCVSMIASLLERKCWLSLGGIGTLYPNLYIILCGEPGTGKTVSSNIACNFIKDYNETLPDEDQLIFSPDVSTPAAIIQLLKESQRIVKGVPMVGDMPQAAVFMHSTELENLVKDIGGGSMVGDLLSYYDCKKTFFKKIVGGDQVIKIKGPCVNMLGDTTPTYLSSFLPREAGGTGLTARIIFATELGVVPKDPFPPPGDPALKQFIISEVERIHNMKGAFKFDPKAKALFTKFFEDTQATMYTIQGSSFLRHYYSRKHVHVLKTAMVVSASDSSKRVVTEDHIQQAIDFIDEAEPFMAASFGVKDTMKMEDKASTLIGYIPMEPEFIHESDLYRQMWLSGLFPGGGHMYEDIIAGLKSGKLIKVKSDGQERYFTRTPISIK